MKLIALHGFLGKPSDWDFLDPHFFLLKPPFHAGSDFRSWTDGFHSNVAVPSPKILMGYSMGGRLALHALLANPSKYSAGIVISTHPGLKSKEEKMERYKIDQQTAYDIIQKPWPDLMRGWESQPLFDNSTYRFDRKEEDYDRKELSEQLLNYSLGLQSDLRSELKNLKIPLYWITGENDKKYSELAKEVESVHPFSKHISIPKGAHRAPWENPTYFLDTLKQIVGSFK